MSARVQQILKVSMPAAPEAADAGGQPARLPSIGDGVRTKHAHLTGKVEQVDAQQSRLLVHFHHPVSMAHSWVGADTVEPWDAPAETWSGVKLGPLHAGGVACFVLLLVASSPEERASPATWLILAVLVVQPWVADVGRSRAAARTRRRHPGPSPSGRPSLQPVACASTCPTRLRPGPGAPTAAVGDDTVDGGDLRESTVRPVFLSEPRSSHCPPSPVAQKNGKVD